MIALAALQKLLLQLRVYPAGTSPRMAEEVLTAQAAEIESLREDAARYRAIRQALMDDDTGFIDRASNVVPDEDVPITTELVDAAIERAVRCYQLAHWQAAPKPMNFNTFVNKNYDYHGAGVYTEKEGTQ